MQTEEQIIETDVGWWIKLAEYLLPHERWQPPINSPAKGKGLVLFVYDYSNGNSTKLIFVPKN